MRDTIEPLLLDLVAWVAKEPREYLEVMEAWRTSCPRLPVWEEANARGFVARARGASGIAMVRVTAEGRAFLATHEAIPAHHNARPARAIRRRAARWSSA